MFLHQWLDYATVLVPVMQQETLGERNQTPRPSTPEEKLLLLQQTVTFTNGE